MAGASARRGMSAREKVDAWLVRNIKGYEIQILGTHRPFNRIASTIGLCKHFRHLLNFAQHQRGRNFFVRPADKLLFLTHADTRATCCTMESPFAQRWKRKRQTFLKLRKMCKLNLSLRALNV